jgi:hypothetical protein
MGSREVNAMPSPNTGRTLCGSTDSRRVHPRLRCKGIARIRLLPHGRWMDGILADLSIRGCCIETEEPLQGTPESSIEVLLKVKGTNLRLNGTIRHCTRHIRAGIQFLDVSPRKSEQIRDLMADLLEMDRLAVLEGLIDAPPGRCA